jgi:quercetin dioxygenase-like cupin family protein
MIIVHESTAPKLKIPKPYKRTLKVLLTPILHKEIRSIACGLTIIPPKGCSDNDSHVEGELFYVIYGRGTININGKEKKLTAGTAIWCPPHVSHFLLNNSSKTLKILWILSPPGRESAIIGKNV